MRRKIVILLVTILVLGTISGCARRNAESSELSNTQDEYENMSQGIDQSAEEDTKEENVEYDRVDSDKEEYEETIKPNQEKYREQLVTIPNEKIVVQIEDEDTFLVIKSEDGKMVQYNIAFYRSEADYISGIQDAKVFTKEILVQDDEAWYLECLSSYQPYEYDEDYDDCWKEYEDDIVQ